MQKSRPASTREHPPVQPLISLPPAMAHSFAGLFPEKYAGWIPSCDPPGRNLGSGGGVAHALLEGWRASGTEHFDEWLDANKKLLLMAGGQSRRLPAYAAESKLLLPLPVLRWRRGERLDQTLADIQLPAYRELLGSAPASYRAMVTSGDVLLRFGRNLPPFPEADVLGLGMWVSPEIASHFGVFFLAKHQPGSLAFFLQKPDPQQIRELSRDYFYLVDTGMWLLSNTAVRALLCKCGAGDPPARGDAIREYELYAGLGLALGETPHRPDPDLAHLRAAVLPLPDARFYHLGTSRQLIEACAELQNVQLDQTRLSGYAASPHPNQFLSSARFGPGRDRLSALWVENAVIPATWSLESDHVLTAIPENDWSLTLRKGQCLDMPPVVATAHAIRPYGIDDSFRGPLQEATWLGRPAREWFAERELEPEDCDIQHAHLFPVVERAALDPEFIQWMLGPATASPEHARTWQTARKLSAAEIVSEIHLQRLAASRQSLRRAALPRMVANFRKSGFHRLDLGHAARDAAAAGIDFPELHDPPDDPILLASDAMLRSVRRRFAGEDGDGDERRAFGFLRDEIVRRTTFPGVRPARELLDDQIVWGRSPVRLDLAGGWSDTPPYCLLRGGKVLNLAADINGQPPIQVFVRPCPEPRLVIRSIDLGAETQVTTHEELAGFDRVGDPFSLAKAALALAGFLPRFHASGEHRSLEAHLREAFGGGLELTLLSAVPKGSGLGTSSILAATVLATLSETCGLGWDRRDLFQRTIALEQLLTTGGGWQDQAGGIYRGIKLVETEPGFDQVPGLRWLPEHLFRGDYANRRVLLYYTGITRLAKGILREIVRGMFLNSRDHLAVLDELADHAEDTFRAIQSGEWDDLARAIRKSWQLNCRLDPGTNPPPVAAILESIAPWCDAFKLLGAGGGGYLLLLAKDDSAAAKLRRHLQQTPPNATARFVDFSVSDTGLQVTRS